MKKTRTMLTALAVSVFMMCCALIAQGTTNRSFVSGTGSDTNTGTDCQQTAPCRTFQAAINQTNAGGQVVALDSTGYAAFSVNKAITIEGAPGQTAFIFVGAGGAGITVTGSANTDLVVLRNLYVDGMSNGSTTGLNFTGPAKLVVQNCTFRSLTTGISAAGVNNTTAPARMDLISSDLYSNGTGILATGDGVNHPVDPQHISTTVVRVVFGNITTNTTGVNSVNPGSNRNNVGFFGLGSAVVSVNLSANTTQFTCSGAGCLAQPIVYSLANPVGP